jgi:hypothetical protein
MAAELSLFWSYAHSDDTGERGRIKLLATHLADEVRVLSSMELRLFVDRTSIGWGDEWREKIDGALSASTFLVSVLSPTYFQRSECRRELIDFYREAESRALDKLLLPISYVAVPDFDAANPDEVVAIAARYQYEDWTSLRLKDPDSEEYRVSINTLAARLLALHAAMKDRERQNLDSLHASSGVPEVGFYEALEEINRRLPAWIEAVDQDVVHKAQFEATDMVYEQRLRRAPRAKHLSILHRFATDEVALMTVAGDLARNYSSLSVEMAPYIATVIRGARDTPAIVETLRPLYEAVTEAVERITRKTPANKVEAVTYWLRWEKMGGIFKTIIAAHERSRQYRREGNALVLEWNTDLRLLFGGDEDGFN